MDASRVYTIEQLKEWITELQKEDIAFGRIEILTTPISISTYYDKDDPTEVLMESTLTININYCVKDYIRWRKKGD